MNQELWTKVEEYFGPLVQEDKALKAAAKEGESAGLPAIAVSPNEGKLLLLMAQMIGARKILEVGTLAGYSTIWLARGLSEGGRLITLEYEQKHAEVAKKNIARAGLNEVVDVRVGDATKTMSELLKEGAGPFDLIFLDANKDGYPTYFEWALKLSRKGTVIVADNVVRDGGVIDAASKDASIQGVRRFNELVAAEKRVSATAIQTVGSKGYDGFAVALVL
ncbi:MAG TPA: O-methyltransferase [Candidatus Dormibacteraeota bacterium]|nr:O-methyltransferase [Candidatus Dormibacteraeota bacterium]